MYHLFVFASLTRAQQGARLLNAAGVKAVVVKSPRGAVLDGCTHGVRVSPDRVEQAKRALAAAAAPVSRLYLVQRDGSVREVPL